MIQNELEYRVAKEQAAKLERILCDLSDDPKSRPHIDPRLQEAERHAVEDLLERVNRQIAEFEGVINGTRVVIYVHSFDELPTALTRARKMAGLSEAELATSVGISSAELCEHERTDFTSASYGLLTAIADVLNVSVVEPLALGVSISEEWAADLRARLANPFERAAVAESTTHD